MDFCSFEWPGLILPLTEDGFEIMWRGRVAWNHKCDRSGGFRSIRKFLTSEMIIV